MIKKLEIKNFKTVKELSLDCKKINVFIGEPDSGKSNILESLGILSFIAYHDYGNLKDFIRFERIRNLFRNEYLDEPLTIKSDGVKFSLRFNEGKFIGELRTKNKRVALLEGDAKALKFIEGSISELAPFKFYRFVPRDEFPVKEFNFLLPPVGANLVVLLLTSKQLRSVVNDIFAQFKLKFSLNTQENKIEVIKQLGEILLSNPYSLASDTLQRSVFLMTAVLSSKGSILIFEEPETHAFPYYTKYLAETIALDTRNNQFFISTHNPYFLSPLLEKAPRDDIAVFITYFEDYQTRVKSLTADQIDEISGMDIFSNLDMFLEEG